MRKRVRGSLKHVSQKNDYFSHFGKFLDNFPMHKTLNYRIAGKFGGLAIYITTAKLKSANILAIAILGSTAKFNSHQYLRLYGIMIFTFSCQ